MRRAWYGCLIAWLLHAVDPARAEEQIERVRAQPDLASEADDLAQRSAEPRAVRPLAALGPLADGAGEYTPPESRAPPGFQDHRDLVGRMRGIRSLSLLRLWKSPRLTVFFGFNQRGMAGLHFKSRDPKDVEFDLKHALSPEPSPEVEAAPPPPGPFRTP